MKSKKSSICMPKILKFRRAVAADGERADGYSTQCNNDSRDYAFQWNLSLTIVLHTRWKK